MNDETRDDPPTTVAEVLDRYDAKVALARLVPYSQEPRPARSG